MTEGLGFEPADENLPQTWYWDVAAERRAEAEAARQADAAADDWKNLEIGRDPGGNTDWGQYILDAIHAAHNGQRIRITFHGQPYARLTPP